MCCDLSLFSSYISIPSNTNNIITIPNGTTVKIAHKGTIVLGQHLTLHNVLHVPTFHFNLISVTKLCQDMNCSLIFSNSHCSVQGPSLSKPILLGKLVQGLYHLVDQPHKSNQQHFRVPSNSICCMASEIEHTKLWHLRLGHAPFPVIKHLFPSLNVSTCIRTCLCNICPSARQNRSPFPHSTIKTTHAFHLLHMDVWGPYKHPTYNNCNSFLTIVDDFTRITWIFLLKTRSQVPILFEHFYSYVATQFHTHIQGVRTDNAPELSEGKIKQFYHDKGINNYKSCTYTPQQNGVVERKHKHLLETARALYFQSKLPIKFWGECVLTAAHIINRLPLQSLNNISPYQKLFGIKPNLEHLKCFGCLCYASNISPHRAKFDTRATPCIFIGYPTNQKAYKLYDLNTHKIIISRDVYFYEKHYPYHINSDTTNTQPHYPFFLPISTNNDFPVTDIFDTPIFSDHKLSSTTNLKQVNSDIPTPNIIDLSHSINTSPAPIRQSNRHTKVPQYLSDYICNNASCIANHWCTNMSCTAFINPKQSLMAHISYDNEPPTYKIASQDPKWVHAMQQELQALIANNTWVLVDLPAHKKPIGNKWVYKTKFHADGTIERHKARLVAKGYNQKYGIDYAETFSPVIKMATIRSILTIATHHKWKIFQLDVNNAFLHGDLHEEIYMKVPDGFPNPNNQVCLLKKSIYGLKQASRQWFQKLQVSLTTQNFIQSKNDYSLFIKKDGHHITILAVYVDDIIVTGNDAKSISQIKNYLHDTFSIKDLGILHYFLGLEVVYFDAGIILSQTKFTQDLLKESKLTTFKHVVTPLPHNLHLTNDQGIPYDDPSYYRTMVGKLNFLTNTRPDLAFTVQYLSQFMQNPRTPHVAALHHTLNYVHSTANQGINIKGSTQLQLQAYSDSDWASCPNTRRSITGYILLLGSSPISWKSKKQSTVSRSSSEAEYRAMASAASEVTWLVRLLEELQVPSLKPVLLHCDNISAIHIAKNPVFHERTKHIDIDCHFTRDKVLEGLLQLTYLPTQNQLADVLTKILPSNQHQHLISKLGMTTIPSLRGGVNNIAYTDSTLPHTINTSS